MKAVTWQGHRKVAVETVPDPGIDSPTDAIISHRLALGSAAVAHDIFQQTSDCAVKVVPDTMASR